MPLAWRASRALRKHGRCFVTRRAWMACHSTKKDLTLCCVMLRDARLVRSPRRGNLRHSPLLLQHVMNMQAFPALAKTVSLVGDNR